MRNIEDILKHPNLQFAKENIDGGVAEIHVGGWQGSVIWSNGAGWEHISVHPFARRITPSWDDMCKVKEIFFKDDEAVIQVHPTKAEYVNNLENCLHLWRCTYKDMVLPPAILVGIRSGITIDEMREEIRRAYELAGEKNPY